MSDAFSPASSAAHPRLQIIRGLPGSGKSTCARMRYPDLCHFETDQFCRRNGAYRWGVARDVDAHSWLDEMVVRCLGFGFDFVVCGVFPTAGHLGRLVRRGLYSGYDVWISTLEPNPNYSSIHAVRPADFAKMEKAFVPDSLLEDEFHEMESTVNNGCRVYFGCMVQGTDCVPEPDAR